MTIKGSDNYYIEIKYLSVGESRFILKYLDGEVRININNFNILMKRWEFKNNNDGQ